MTATLPIPAFFDRRAVPAALLVALLAACGGGQDAPSGSQQCGGYNQPSCGGGGGGGGYGGGGGGQYVANALVTDTGTGALHADPNLVDGWGLAINPAGYAWVADAGTGVSTLYDGNGVSQSIVVQIPGDASGPASPTGLVYNASTGFAFTANGQSGTAQFIFATQQGRIAAWSATVDATHAFDLIDNNAAGAGYTGLAIGTDLLNSPTLYAANFAQGRVEMFDTGFVDVTPVGAFFDPGLPADYSPFGIQQIGGRVVVAYAQVDPITGSERHVAGAGALDVFDGDGNLIAALVAPGGALDAPWGIALAPADFGPQSNRLLVGNFGDGMLHAFDPTTGGLVGQVMDNAGNAIVIDGLWGIAFGNGAFDQPANTLFYAAGPGGEQHGQYGRIDLN